jgi:hypothetical protein
MKVIDLQQALDAVPTNWLDPMLTGPDKVIGDGGLMHGDRYTSRDIESVLREVRKRLGELPTIDHS